MFKLKNVGLSDISFKSVQEKLYTEHSVVKVKTCFLFYVEPVCRILYNKRSP